MEPPSFTVKVDTQNDISTLKRKRMQEEDIMASIAQLSGSHVNLQSSLTELLEKYASREELLKKTVNDLHDHCAQKLKEAEDEANHILASAISDSTATIAAASSEARDLLSNAKMETEAWEVEKERLSHIKSFESKIKLDVGGVKFTTSLTTLRRFPDTMIGAMFSGRHAMHLDEDGHYFIDRDGTHFRLILNFLRSPETFELDLTGSALKEFMTECDYYGIQDVMFPPIIRIPPFTCNNTGGQAIIVSQEERGMWRATKDNIPLNLCTHCFSAHYDIHSNPFSYCGSGGRKVWHECIYNFKALVESKGGSLNLCIQPKPVGSCKSCHKF